MKIETPDELIIRVREEIQEHGNDVDLNHLDVSSITDFSGVFAWLNFQGRIDKWNVSQAITMHGMFEESQFNGDISAWDVSNVQDMSNMFFGSVFNQDISRWNVGNVKTMRKMFMESLFNRPIGDWNVSNVVDMSKMFESSLFNQDIGNWNVSALLDATKMFDSNDSFNQDLSKWRLFSLEQATYMFRKCSKMKSLDFLPHIPFEKLQDEKTRGQFFGLVRQSGLSAFLEQDSMANHEQSLLEFFKIKQIEEKIKQAQEHLESHLLIPFDKQGIVKKRL